MGNRAGHIGIAGVTAEGAFLCARMILESAEKRLSAEARPRITMDLHPTADYLDAASRSDWARMAKLLVESVGRVHEAGAEFAIVPANAAHYAIDEVIRRAPIPVLSIVDVVAGECVRRGFTRVGVLGVRWTMEGGLYDGPLKKRGIEGVIPGLEDRDAVHKIILEELIKFRVREESTARLRGVVEGLKGQGCRAMVLACTELPLSLSDGDCGVAMLDTTRLLAEAALERAIASIAT